MNNPTSQAEAPPKDHNTSRLSDRTKKQLKIVLGGVYFVVLSTLVTRRAVARRIRWAKPTYFRQNMHHPEQEFNSGLEAAEALTVATINVFSWGIFFTGGAMWATDTCGLEEVRQRLRVRLNLTEEEQTDSQQIVKSWLKAANPLNAFKSEEEHEPTLEHKPIQEHEVSTADTLRTVTDSRIRRTSESDREG